MKRISTFLIIVIMIFALCSCRRTDATPDSNSGTNHSSDVSDKISDVNGTDATERKPVMNDIPENKRYDTLRDEVHLPQGA